MLSSTSLHISYWKSHFHLVMPVSQSINSALTSTYSLCHHSSLHKSIIEVEVVGKQFRFQFNNQAAAAHPVSNFVVAARSQREPQLFLSRASPSHPPSPTSPPHLSGRLPTVYPSASCSLVDRRRTWTRIDSRAYTQDHPPSALDNLPFRLPYRATSLPRGRHQRIYLRSPLHRRRPDQTFLRPS